MSLSVGFGNTSRRLTHGTTTLSQEAEDYDHWLDPETGVRYNIKPKSITKRDAPEEKSKDVSVSRQMRDDDDDRS